MFFKYLKKKNILHVDESFARLLTITTKNSDLIFEFTYRVNQKGAIKNNALSVDVTVLTQQIKANPILQTLDEGKINAAKAIDNILLLTQNAKSAQNQQEEYVVATKKSDVTAKINNEIMSKLAANVSVSAIPEMTKTKLVIESVDELKLNNENKPVFQMMAHTSFGNNVTEAIASSQLTNTKKAMFDMIYKDGIDPSTITGMTPLSVPAVSVVGGLLQSVKLPEKLVSASKKMLNYHIFSGQQSANIKLTNFAPPSALVHVVKSVVQEDVDVPIRVTIPSSKMVVNGKKTLHLMVKFDLIDSVTGLSVDTIVKPLDVSRHIQLYHTPKKAPIVRVAKSEISSKVSLDIKQVDNSASAVNVYQKNMSPVSNDVEDYVLVGKYAVKSNQQSLLVSFPKSRNSIMVFRVVPVGEDNTLGSEFTNVIVRPQKVVLHKAINLNAQVIENGVRLEISQIPVHATSVIVMRRSLTSREKNYELISEPILFDDGTKALDFVSFIDSFVDDGNVYDYALNVIFEDGTVSLSKNTIVEYVKLTPGKIDLKINDLTVTQSDNGPNVTFTIQSTVLNDDLDVVLALLKRQDIKEFFTNDVLKQRDKLKSLIAYNIQRVNLSTGVREDFGVISEPAFNDEEMRKNNSVLPLRRGHNYRYEVHTLLRAPETLFSEFEKSKIDSITNKTYSFRPSKFLHPIPLKDGTIVSANGVKLLYGKSEFSLGVIGVMESIDVTLEGDIATIIDASAAKFDKDLNVITWKIEGTIDKIDHFLIIKEVLGVRTMIGKSHCEFDSKNVQYIHVTKDKDFGELRYVIVPIFNDYSVGNETYTNSVIV